jgi:HSP20 family molecular chaperone IbpA
MVTSYKRHDNELKFAANEVLDSFVPFLDSVFFDTTSRRVNCFTDEGDFYGLELEMAGFGKKDVKLEVSGGRYLVVKGSIKRGEKEHKVSERFQLPRDAEVSDVAAELKEGLLIVKINKTNGSKPVTVKVS